tara:strand:+ start:1901 stop:2563 length:663 start_codon:yes stop_codon:yes gene_type:complete
MGVRKVTRLAQCRMDKGITQIDMANSVGVSQATYMRYENGIQKPRNPEIVERMSRLLGMPVNSIYKDMNLEIPNINLQISATKISKLTVGSENTIIHDQDLSLDYIDKVDLINDTDMIAIRVPYTYKWLQKDMLALAVPNAPYEFNRDLVFICMEYTVKKNKGKIVEDVVQRSFQPGTVITKEDDVFIVDHGDNEPRRYKDKEINSIYKITQVVIPNNFS